MTAVGAVHFTELISALQVLETATANLSGSVRDRDASSPLPGATVTVVGGPDAGRATTSDTDGRYFLSDLHRGVFPVRFSAAGFLEIDRSLTLTQDAALDVELCRLPPTAPTLTASVSGRDVTFSWNWVPLASRFLIEAGTSPGVSNELATHIQINRFVWRPAAGMYYGRVRAVRSQCGAGPVSNEVMVSVS